MDKKALINSIKRSLESRKEVQFAYLFGSFLEDDNFRDIDLAVYIDKKNPACRDKFYEMELSNQVERIVKYPVDIVVLNNASSAIVFRASKGMLLKDKDEDTRTDFITLNWKKYWDFKPTLRYHMEERKRGSR